LGENATRVQIVEAADGLFYRQGFEHTSFTDIAEAVRISRGNFYYYFKTKDEILEAVIAGRMKNTQAMLARWEAEGETPADRIRRFGEANKLFTLFRVWRKRQFEAAGRREDADALALHLLARSQGVATLANALRDEAFIRREVQEMYDWLDVQLAKGAGK